VSSEKDTNSFASEQLAFQARLECGSSGQRSAQDFTLVDAQPYQNIATLSTDSKTELNKHWITKQKSCLTDHSTPASSVSAFCRAVLQRLVPDEFYGVGDDGKSNRRVVLKNVDRFVQMSRFESLTLHEVCKGLKVREYLWG
jgi:telomerase reverse transcriptase